MRISYETWHGSRQKPVRRFRAAVEKLAAQGDVRSICDVGAGANPVLDAEWVAANGIERYVVLDVSAAELEKAPPSFERVVADITKDPLDRVGTFDLVVSQTVAEHVTDPAAFHRVVRSLLNPGGRAMHYFPTFYDPVFVLNRLLPEAVSERILLRVQSKRARGGRHGKFPAYYRWCRGPTRRQLRLLRETSFEVEEYVGIFGHNYFRSTPPLDRLWARVSELLGRHPVAALTSYSWVTLRLRGP